MPFAVVATVCCAKRGGPLNTGDVVVVGGAREDVDVGVEGVERRPRRPTTGAAGDSKREEEEEEERDGGGGLSNISCMTSCASICWASVCAWVNSVRAVQNKTTTQPRRPIMFCWLVQC
jgi:hypothetical protein